MAFEKELLGLVNNYGLWGLFLASAICTASIFFPMPASLIILAGSQLFGSLPAALVGGFGAGVGEVSAYILSREGRVLLSDEQKEKIEEYKKKIGKWGFLVIFFSACLPFFPIDVVSIAAGLLKYDAAKYTAAVLSGRFIYASVLAYTGNAFFNGVLS